MEQITNFFDRSTLKENKIIVNPEKSSASNSKIFFTGKGNILCVEDGVKLDNSTIRFNGSNSIVYVCENSHRIFLNISTFNSSTIFVGKGSYFNGAINIAAAEYQNIIIGDDCLFSFGIWIRTADPHLIFDVESKKRINPSKGVLIGDHVWIGQDAMILKGSQIGSGSIVGGRSVVSGKELDSNCCYGGNPAKKLRSSIFFAHDCVNDWTVSDTEKHSECDTEQWIYQETEKTIDFEEIDNGLKKHQDPEKRLEYIKRKLVQNKDKNRFCINSDSKGSKNKVSGKLKKLFG